ncbi:hypothetical protein Acife_1927 [Acidithiobacillus ferrivorans SS3]|uniref:Uncharacterized protein n=1 Tax=Acidithiobacillus ferrivorans SS3 TaxID=743299 RepID=G0JLK1_9PROT|nr:hypothetical protein [Acidithiobacillus ferrivorans]AEM48050.1 hypothetical protein Acife_1927 [Acidithiobacillus ferrivorans SS3]
MKNQSLPFIILEKGQLSVCEYITGKQIPHFNGLARDCDADRFVLVSVYPGHETEINYLVSDTIESALQEIEYLKAKFGIQQIAA